MNQSTKKQRHEQQRKKHKHDAQVHARELAKQGRSKTPLWFLLVGIVVIVGFVLTISFR